MPSIYVFKIPKKSIFYVQMASASAFIFSIFQKKSKMLKKCNCFDPLWEPFQWNLSGPLGNLYSLMDLWIYVIIDISCLFRNRSKVQFSASLGAFLWHKMLKKCNRGTPLWSIWKDGIWGPLGNHRYIRALWPHRGLRIFHWKGSHRGPKQLHFLSISLYKGASF